MRDHRRPPAAPNRPGGRAASGGLARPVVDCCQRAGVAAPARSVGRVAIAPVTSRALDTYIAHRTNGPIFLNRDNTARLSYTSASQQLRRLVRAACVPSADAIHPHSFRHTFATEALDAGAALQDVQDALGHADPRTTGRYDRSGNRLDKDPTYALAADGPSVA